MSELTNHHLTRPPRQARRRPPRVSTAVYARWGWISLPLVVLGIVVPAIQSRDGGAIGLIARLTSIPVHVVGLLFLGMLVAGIVTGYLSRRHRAGRIAMGIGLGYIALGVVVGLLGLL